MLKKYKNFLLILIIILVGLALAKIMTKEELVVNVVLESPDASMTGSAIIKNIGGSAMALVSLPKAPDDDEIIQPMFINSGSCDNLGQVKYSLTVQDAGESETDLDIKIEEFIKLRPMAINIHKSVSEPTVVSCGNI